MSRKYRKIGLRRENNLSDVDNKYTALLNLINGLAAPGETFIPEDIAVINNLRNTNITNEDFAQIKGLKITYLDEQNTQRTLTPIVTLEDRVQTYKLPVGDPPYVLGGNGMLAKFIPSANIASSINSDTLGSDVFNELPDQIQGPLLFWDNGVFEFQNLIFPDFNDPYGMIQWEGFFSPEPGDQNITLQYSTTGLILIEQDPFNNNNWETLKSIYNATRSITFESSQQQTEVTNIVIGSNIAYVNIGDQLTSINSVTVENIFIIDINFNTGTIVLDTPINLVQGTNTLTVNFSVGRSQIQSFFTLRNSYTGDRIKIRVTVWWPNPGDPTIIYNSKIIQFKYINSTRPNFSSDDLMSYEFLFSNFDRVYVPDSQSIEYFLNNHISTINTKTDFKLTVNSNVLSNYNPPQALLDRLDDTSIQTFTFNGLGKISKTDGFVNVITGDYFIRKDNYVKTYQIKEKGNSSIVYVSPFDDVLPTINSTFDGFIIKQLGLVGVYNIENGVISPLQDNDFTRSIINTDQLLFTINSANNQISGFFRIISYNYETGAIEFANITDTVGTPSNDGIAVVYRSSSLEDLSKLSFCKGVVGKEVSSIANIGTTKIYLKDTLGLAVDMYVQLEGHLPSTTQISSIGSDAGGNFINLKNGSVTSQINQDITLTFSPDSVNRELCVIPLNTAPPFAGTITGLITQPNNEALSVNKITIDSLQFKDTTISTVVSPNTVTKSMQFTANGETYRFLIK
jgi:hypothetical protein